MPAKKESDAPEVEPEEVYEQATDDRGRQRLDRRLTTEEARDQDEANREAFLEERRGRFDGRVAE